MFGQLYVQTADGKYSSTLERKCSACSRPLKVRDLSNIRSRNYKSPLSTLVVKCTLCLNSLLSWSTDTNMKALTKMNSRKLKGAVSSWPDPVHVQTPLARPSTSHDLWSHKLITNLWRVFQTNCTNDCDSVKTGYNKTSSFHFLPSSFPISKLF